jgi:hypothetical protein
MGDLAHHIRLFQGFFLLVGCFLLHGISLLFNHEGKNMRVKSRQWEPKN